MRAYLKHKLNLSLLFTILLCTFSSNTFAFDAIIDGIYYYFLDGKAHVTCYAYNSKYNKTAYSGNVVIPETITYYGQTFNVKYIDDHAFIGCTGLTSVTIPNSVISIGSSAFDGCRSLTSVTIPESITTINSYTFTSCSALTSITIPESVKSIGEGAFRWSGITSVTIPESVTTIGENAFQDCSNLTSVKVESNAIMSRSLRPIFGPQVKTYIIGDNVKTIGAYAFQNYSALTSITIPESVTSIGESAFQYCSGLTSVTIPNNVTDIGSRAFYICQGLTSVTIGNNVTSIGKEAFYWCTSLTSLTIGNSVTSIGKDAFNCCYGLTSITFPESVASIGENAFYECSGLTSITCEALTPPVCGSGCFILVDRSLCTLYVPEISVDAYKNANEWKDFYNIIGVATGINDVKITDFEDGLYDLSGRKLSKPQRGINIIRNNDGTAKKVVVQ